MGSTISPAPHLPASHFHAAKSKPPPGKQRNGRLVRGAPGHGGDHVFHDWVPAWLRSSGWQSHPARPDISTNSREITVAQLDARPLLIVVSGPSGAGKGTALEHATHALPLRKIPTYTTRPMRPGEKDGIDYEYVDEERFLQLYQAGVIFEYSRTYARSYYGSPRALLRDDIENPLIVELDPNGFVRVRAASARRVVGIFVTTSSESELRARLASRAQDSDISQRLKISTEQLKSAWVYDYVVFNEDREQFLADVTVIIQSELLRTSGAKRMLDRPQEMDLSH